MPAQASCIRIASIAAVNDCRLRRSACRTSFSSASSAPTTGSASRSGASCRTRLCSFLRSTSFCSRARRSSSESSSSSIGGPPGETAAGVVDAAAAAATTGASSVAMLVGSTEAAAVERASAAARMSPSSSSTSSASAIRPRSSSCELSIATTSPTCISSSMPVIFPASSGWTASIMGYIVSPSSCFCSVSSRLAREVPSNVPAGPDAPYTSLMGSHKLSCDEDMYAPAKVRAAGRRSDSVAS